MFFLIQNDITDIEITMLLDILNHQKYIHEYELISIKEINNLSGLKYKKAIPVGTINFVELWLDKFYSIEHITPIEIPQILRTEEFLKRKYQILDYDKLPREGYYFIKDASRLKVFSYTGNIDIFFENHSPGYFDNSIRLDKTHKYQLSEIVNIKSEYRIYFISGEIQNISNYDGDPKLFPDIKLIEKANLLYSTQKDYPKSYSMDIMITDKGTSIIEIHPFVSIGLYSTLWGANLIYAYRDGIDWIINNAKGRS